VGIGALVGAAQVHNDFCVVNWYQETGATRDFIDLWAIAD
jgi:hypothetical protein